MIKLRKLSVLFGSDNMDINVQRIGLSRASAIFEGVFSLVEAGVVLGALKAAMIKTQSDAIALIWILGYFATGLYVLMAANYLTALAFQRLGWTSASRATVFFFRSLTFIISMAVPYVIDIIAADIIVQALK